MEFLFLDINTYLNIDTFINASINILKNNYIYKKTDFINV